LISFARFFGFAFLLLFFYIFVFILIENLPLKKIARLYEARLYFVVDKEKRLLEKLVELLQFYVEIVPADPNLFKHISGSIETCLHMKRV
jgi:hypothetical protein